MDNCKGCATFQSMKKFSNCSHIKYNKNAACPCTSCIVKAMCDHSCEDYEEWADSLIKKGKENEA